MHLKRINLIIGLGFLIFSVSFGQTITARVVTDDELVDVTTKVEAYYHIYEPVFKAAPSMKSMAEAKNRYPEELMISLMSENSTIWVDYNTWDGTREKTSKYFKQKVQWNPDDTYFALTSKFEFKVGGTWYAYMRFRLHGKTIDKSPVGVYLLRKEGERWYYSKEVLSNEMNFIFFNFKPELLGKILKGEKNGDAQLDQLITAISTKGGIDLAQLEREVMKAYEAGEKSKDKSFSNYFFEPLNW
ncbi:MAG: hypothetical protein AAGG68_29650 [Bacteroidota bacterium]